MLSPLVVITGPTASGKSALAMQIAQKYNGEIICADSRTVYKGMDIGTAKPSKVDQHKVRHHLLDVAEPSAQFTASDFKRLAESAIDDIVSRDKLPIMVGGTGLYIDAIIFNYQFGPQPDPEYRALLQHMTVKDLQQMCQDKGITPPSNNTNKRHLIRAIELGGSVSDKKRLRHSTIVVGITTDRDELLARVEDRAAKMAQSGVLKEVKRLGKTYGWEAEAMTGNIYRVLHAVVKGEMLLDEALNLVAVSDMQLAKRQLTWFKRNPFIIWGNAEQVTIAIEHFVQQINVSKSIPLTL